MPSGRRIQPSLFDFVFVLWVTVIPIALSGRLLSTDGDLPRHLRLGEWMLSHGRLLTVDNFSFTRAGTPFVAFEWGSEVLYALAHRAGGLAGVAVLAGLLLALTYALVVRFLLRRGVEPLLAYLTSIAAALLGASHWVARPHLVTLLLVVLLLELVERTDRRSLWWYLPFFCLWTNLHGGFTYGLMLIGLYLAGDVLEWLVGGRQPEWRDRARHRALALLLAVVGVALNANGWRLFAHLISFFGQPILFEKTQEFLSPDFHVLNGKLFLYALLAIVAGLAVSRRRPSGPHLVVLLANIAFALHSQRNVELFAVTALPLMAWHLDAEWRTIPGLDRIKRAFAQEQDARYRGVPSALFAAEMIALGAVGGTVGGTEIVADHFDPKVFPVAAVEQARRDHLTGRIYAEFIWGGYLLYAWPEQKVFIDGGTDHYGEELVKEHLQLAQLMPGWRDVLQRWDISLALLASDVPLAHELAREPGWAVRWCDETAAILERRPAGAGGPRADLIACYNRKQAAEKEEAA
jgi:hypothetical protein